MWENLKYVFIDESGGHSLDYEKEGTTEYYSVCGIMIDKEEKERIEASVGLIRKKYFGDGVMKSNSVGNNTKRRNQILKELTDIELRFSCLVIDKKQIYKDSGLKWKKSFIKYVHSWLYNWYFETFFNLEVIADEHGTPEFMNEFQEYMRKKRKKPDMLIKQNVSFAKDEDEVMVQVSDIIAGSCRRLYAGKDNEETRELLQRMAVIIELWPPSKIKPDLTTNLKKQERINHLISRQSVLFAREFISEHEDSDDDIVKSQVAAVKYLLYKYELDPNNYTYSNDILAFINKYRNKPLKERAFYTRIIAELRSKGVIIASSSFGYKIPNSMADIDLYVNLVNNQTIPYLSRLADARKSLFLASNSEYDMVNSQKYSELFSCIRAIENKFPSEKEAEE